MSGVIFAGGDTVSSTLSLTFWCGYFPRRSDRKGTCRTTSKSSTRSTPSSRRPWTIRSRSRRSLSSIRCRTSAASSRRVRLAVLGDYDRAACRLFTAVPPHLERVVPDGGLEVLGFHLPASTVVAGQAWSMHRRPHVFPDSDSFEPERWLEPTSEMRDAMMCAAQRQAQLTLQALRRGHPPVLRPLPRVGGAQDCDGRHAA